MIIDPFFIALAAIPSAAIIKIFFGKNKGTKFLKSFGVLNIAFSTLLIPALWVCSLMISDIEDFTDFIFYFPIFYLLAFSHFLITGIFLLKSPRKRTLLLSAIGAVFQFFVYSVKYFSNVFESEECGIKCFGSFLLESLVPVGDFAIPGMGLLCVYGIVQFAFLAMTLRRS